VRQICDERGLVLILDEVQTGLGRTGKWFGFHHAGIQPDVVTMAKGLGNGVPIGAVWAVDEVASAFGPGDHGSTFAGQPLAASAARAVLRILEEIEAPRLAAERGAELAALLEGLAGVASVRGLGLLLAVELDTNVLASRTAPEVALACLNAGLVVNGVTPTALRMAPPLTVSSDELAQGVEILAGILGSSPCDVEQADSVLSDGQGKEGE